jgi:hypothetical protein
MHIVSCFYKKLIRYVAMLPTCLPYIFRLVHDLSYLKFEELSEVELVSGW